MPSKYAAPEPTTPRTIRLPDETWRWVDWMANFNGVTDVEIIRRSIRANLGAPFGRPESEQSDQKEL